MRMPSCNAYPIEVLFLPGGYLDKINFNAVYQRVDNQWSISKKKRLIDTSLGGYHLDPLSLYKNKDERLDCMDGKQRGKALLDFRANKFHVIYEDESIGVKKQKIRYSDLKKAFTDKDHPLYKLANRFFHYAVHFNVYEEMSLEERLRTYSNKGQATPLKPCQAEFCINFLARVFFDYVRSVVDDDALHIFKSWRDKDGLPPPNRDDLRVIAQTMIGNFGDDLDSLPKPLKNQLGIPKLRSGLECINLHIGRFFDEKNYDVEQSDQYFDEKLIRELGYFKAFNNTKIVFKVISKICDDKDIKLTHWQFNHIAYVLIQKLMWGKASATSYSSSYDQLGKWVDCYLLAYKTQKANRGDRQERMRDVEVKELLRRWPLTDLSLGPQFGGVYVAKTEKLTLKIGKADDNRVICDRLGDYRTSSSSVEFQGLLSYKPEDEDYFLNMFSPWNIKASRGGKELFVDSKEFRDELDKHLIYSTV